jgi:hypothetical protein
LKIFKSDSNNRKKGSIDEMNNRVDAVEKLRRRKGELIRPMTPEERYQNMKEAWYFHESSWYMRHDNGYDGHGCNNGVCIPECRYYAEQGRIEDDRY